MFVAQKEPKPKMAQRPAPAGFVHPARCAKKARNRHFQTKYTSKKGILQGFLPHFAFFCLKNTKREECGTRKAAALFFYSAAAGLGAGTVLWAGAEDVQRVL